MAGKASGAVEMAASHTLAHSMSKDIPSASKCKPKSLDCYCFPALDSLAQGFILLSPPNEFSSSMEILHFFSPEVFHFM